MAQRFLTDAWFDEYQRLRAGVEVPQPLAELLVNLTIRTDDGGVLEARMDGGFLQRGHREGAIASITAPAAIIYTGIVLGDLKSALPAVFSGQLRIDGSKAALIKLAGIAPTPSQQALTEKLRLLTDL